MIAITQPFETERDEATGKIRALARPQGSFDQWERCLKLMGTWHRAVSAKEVVGAWATTEAAAPR